MEAIGGLVVTGECNRIQVFSLPAWAVGYAEIAFPFNDLDHIFVRAHPSGVLDGPVNGNGAKTRGGIIPEFMSIYGIEVFVCKVGESSGLFVIVSRPEGAPVEHKHGPIEGVAYGRPGFMPENKALPGHGIQFGL
jgi:hypothetical protein